METQVSTLGLSLAYWLHMLSTVVWLGGLSSLALLILPAGRKSLDERSFANLLEAVQRRLDPIGWFCLILLTGTGMFQMSASPNYTGFLAIGNLWATAILLKHIVFFLMIGSSAWMTWGILPALRRSALRLSQGKEDPQAAVLYRRNQRLLWLNLALSILVLALTALARAS